jgi:hypothetical protein
MMAKGQDLGARGAGWPESPSEEMDTYEEMLGALMTAPHFKLLQEDEVWGGAGEAWGMALIAAMGYKSADAANVACKARAIHTWTGLRNTLVEAKLEEAWRVGVWHDAEADSGDDDGGAAVPAAVPAAVARWLKTQKMTVVPVGGAAKKDERNRGGAGRGEANRAQADDWDGAIEDGRRGHHGEFPRNRMMQQSPWEDLSGDPPTWSPRFFPATTFDRFVADFGHAAYLDAERRSDSGGLTCDKFAHLLARNEMGEAPGYPEALPALRPAGVTVLHSYTARVASHGVKVPLAARQVAEVAERYFAAFKTLLSSSSTVGASDRTGAVFRLRAMGPPVEAARAACAKALGAWRAVDAVQGVWALEVVRTEVLRLAAEVYNCQTFVDQNEVLGRIQALAPLATSTFADAHANAYAKESKKREGAVVDEPPGKKNKLACRFGAKCKRHLAFEAGTNAKDCPDGSH